MWQGKILTVQERALHAYHPLLNSWVSQPIVGLSGSATLDSCSTHRAGSTIYLTSRYSRDIYRYDSISYPLFRILGDIYRIVAIPVLFELLPISM